MPAPVTTPVDLRTTEAVLAANNSERMLQVIHEVIKTIPELQFFAASPVPKDTYSSLVVTGLPTVAFRKPGTFRTFDAPKVKNMETKCAFLDASWVIERALAIKHDKTKEFAFGLQTKTHMQAALFLLSQQIWYGVQNDTEGFAGLAAFIDNAAEYVVDVSNPEATTALSSVFAVSTSEETLQIAWGNEGQINEGDVFEQMLTTEENTKGATHYVQTIDANAGLQIGAKWCAGRLRGLSPTNGLTDEMLFKLIATFPAGRAPQAFFMTRRSLEQLRSSRQAFNTVGAPAPTPTEVGGIPIYATDAISNAEETLPAPPTP